jgi:Methylase involved in ubiquinone/menaquinone biosynthesis
MMKNLFKFSYMDKEFYEKVYQSGKTPWPSDTPEPVFEDFLKKIKPEFDGKSLSCLDAGCGEGRHMILLKKIFPNSKVVGFDILRTPLITTRQRISVFQNTYIAVADVFSIPFKSETFDIVLDFGVFHHVRKKMLRTYKSELMRVLKKGGYFLIGVFSTKFKHHIHEVRKRHFIYHKKHYDRFFTEETLKQEFDFLRPIEVLERGRDLEWFIYGLFKKE